ncbi:MAG: hypothetical protein F4Y82_00545 [Cenarchaeum sp. SB0665_bin_23]|nr:hypothetical protein [Cenarchaeum sp. SB0665_bin_23]MYG32689.1 hypothetical protein [Cenarchaeum sp. SB0677_bin_16]
MKLKTFHALLLSIVMVAGVMTINDAFAQTNTERLVTVADTTADTNSRVVQLTEIWNNFGNQFTPITEALNLVAEEITAISDEISTLSGDVMAASAKVDSLENKLDSYAETRASDSEAMMGQINDLADALPDIQEKISTLAGDTSVSDLAAKVDNIATQLDNFSDALRSIQNEVQGLQSEVGTISSTTTTETGPTPTDLNEGMLEEDVLVKWYSPTEEELPDDYTQVEFEADFYFTCESDVFINTVNATDISPMSVDYYNTDTRDSAEEPANIVNHVFRAPPTDADGNIVLDTNLLVNSETIIDTKFTRTGDDPEGLFIKEQPFNLLELKAGEALTFKSTTKPFVSGSAIDILYAYANTAMNTEIAAHITDADGAVSVLAASRDDTDANNHGNSTKAQLGDVVLYSVEVNYYSEASDAKCKISPASVAPLDNIGQVVLVSPKAKDKDAILSTYDAMLDCDLNKVSITDISATLSGANNFNNFVNIKLVIDDDEELAEFTFENNTLAVDPESLPIEFEGQNLIIKGDVIASANLLIAFTYDTIEDAECKQVLEE